MGFGQRSLFYTLKNEIYVGEIDFKMNPIKKYKHFHTMARNIHEIAMGAEHCLILDVDKRLWAIGDNTYGEIGIEENTNSDKVNEVKFFANLSNTKVTKIAVGARHSLVLCADGSLYSFGDNSDGQCTGFSTRYSTPNKIGGELRGKVVDVKCGYNHCLVILETGELYAWGDNSFGKLTIRENSQNLNSPKILQILKGKSICKISLGFQMTIIATSKLENSITWI